jgi:hypothetical protein
MTCHPGVVVSWFGNSLPPRLPKGLATLVNCWAALAWFDTWLILVMTAEEGFLRAASADKIAVFGNSNFFRFLADALVIHIPFTKLLKEKKLVVFVLWIECKKIKKAIR